MAVHGPKDEQPEDALLDQAIKLRDEGDLERSGGILVELAKKNPLAAAAFGILADVRWRQGRTMDSIRYFKEATRLSPTSEAASLGLFHTLWETGQQEQAKCEMARYLSLAKSEEYDWLRKELGEGHD